ncbi:hypothetical protein BU23DRAFT_432500, partial [Bimuria novae-zelandiae CBS 107.79]
ELNANDVPTACTTICAPIVQLTNTCDVDPGARENDDEKNGEDNGAEPDEAVESQCVCSNKSFDVASIAALCASCIQQNGKGRTDDEGMTELMGCVDMDNIMSACKFSSMSYAPSATALVAQVTVSATKPAFTAATATTTTG